MDQTNNSDKTEAGLDQFKEELITLKKMVKKADHRKGQMLLEKIDGEDAKANAQQGILAIVKEQKDCKEAFAEEMKTIQEQIGTLSSVKLDMHNDSKRWQNELEAKKAEATKLKQKFQVDAQIPHVEVKFTARNLEESADNFKSVREVFEIIQKPTLLLRGGHAIIAFEEQKVATQIMKLPKCSVPYELSELSVKPRRITMEPMVQFEIHLDVPKKKLKITNIPAVMPEERIKDRLELCFGRKSTGGGEVESVEYDVKAGTAVITFLHTSVSEDLAKRGKYHVGLCKKEMVKVEPMYNYQLLQFQTFCGTPKQAILIEVMEGNKEDDLLEHIMIHFQKPSNYGGEIECIKYVQSQMAQLAFFK